MDDHLYNESRAKSHANGCTFLMIPSAHIHILVLFVLSRGRYQIGDIQIGFERTQFDLISPNVLVQAILVFQAVLKTNNRPIDIKSSN